MMGDMNLKAQLKTMLRDRGMTAADLSRSTGIPKQSISDWLAGAMPRDLARLKKVADIFSVTIDELIFGDHSDHQRQNTSIIGRSSPDSDGWESGVYEVKFRRIQPGRDKR